MADITVVEIQDGYSFNGSSGIGTRVFVTAAALPGSTGTLTLPSEGDKWSDDYPSMICSDIQETPINATATRYICRYGSNISSFDPLGHAVYNAITSINGSSEVCTYTYPQGSNSVYAGPGGSGFTSMSDPLTITTMATLINVSVTTRYRGTASGLLIDISAYQGKINDNSMWGYSEGCVLCTGVTGTPIEEVVNGVKTVSYNRTVNYSVRLLPINDNAFDGKDTWQYVFYRGSFCRLSSDSQGSSKINMYDYATLPDIL